MTEEESKPKKQLGHDPCQLMHKAERKRDVEDNGTVPKKAIYLL